MTNPWRSWPLLLACALALSSSELSAQPSGDESRTSVPSRHAETFLERLIRFQQPPLAQEPFAVRRLPRVEPVESSDEPGESKWATGAAPRSSTPSQPAVQRRESRVAGSRDQQVHRLPIVTREPVAEAITSATSAPKAPLPAPRWSQWQAQLDSMTRKGYEFASRGAPFAARAEFLRLLRTIAQVGDSHEASRRRSGALSQALRAMQEAEDFVPHAAATDVDLAQIVTGHRTPVLSPTEAQAITPLVAMQRYFSFAQSQLELAVGDVPLAAEALFALGRLQMLMDDDSRVAPTLRAARAMVYYQVALHAEPRHARAANELGVLLARIGRLEEARDVLRGAVAVQPTREMWHNLAVVHHRLGEQQLAALAEAESKRSPQSRAVPGSAAQPIVRWVSQEAFRGTQRQ